MLAWQNKTSLLKQPKQVNHVLKKDYLLRYYQQLYHTNTILAQQTYTLGIKRVPPFFPVVCFWVGDVRKSLSYKRSLRKNGHPLKTINHDQFFNKILQQTNRSTSWQKLYGKVIPGWPQKGKVSTDYKDINQTSVGPFSLLWSKTGDVCKSWPFSNNY